MGVYTRDDSPWFWMLLEGHGRKRERIDIRCDAVAPAVRKKNREAADAIYHARMTQLARGQMGLPNDSPETFRTFSAWYETHHISKHKSAPRERVILAKLRDHFGAMRLADIRPARWTEYETSRQNDGAAINTISRELGVMKAVLRSAVGEHLEVSPLAHVRRKKQRLQAKRTLTAEDEKKILAEFEDQEIHDLYLVGVGTLLRQMNLIMLQRKQLHGDRLVVDTKTGPHTISLDGPTTLQRRALTVLKRRMPSTPDGYFFPEWQKRFAEYRDAASSFFLKRVRRAVKAAGVQWGLRDHGVVWHTMTRASGATRLIRDYGIDIRTVQLMGPWSSLDQMAEYLGVHFTPPSSRTATKKRSA